MPPRPHSRRPPFPVCAPNPSHSRLGAVPCPPVSPQPDADATPWVPHAHLHDALPISPGPPGVTSRCHIPVSHPGVTSRCHIPVSHPGVTSRCHIPVSHPGVTSRCHIPVSHPGVTSRCHIPVSHPGVTSRCHIPVSHPGVTSRCHIPVSHPGVTSRCHIPVSHPGVTSRCHIPVSHPGVTSRCHIQVSHPGVTARAVSPLSHPGVTSQCHIPVPQPRDRACDVTPVTCPCPHCHSLGTPVSCAILVPSPCHSLGIFVCHVPVPSLCPVSPCPVVVPPPSCVTSRCHPCVTCQCHLQPVSLPGATSILCPHVTSWCHPGAISILCHFPVPSLCPRVTSRCHPRVTSRCHLRVPRCHIPVSHPGAISVSLAVTSPWLQSSPRCPLSRLRVLVPPPCPLRVPSGPSATSPGPAVTPVSHPPAVSVSLGTSQDSPASPPSVTSQCHL
ncbi:PREDICTED: soluble scavenger receptor cysteine-rich domain-containing protein SSC5D-like [Ficedula albicollis]|uniref:soluble scavenger receptor cysteine-rich domain-containing protein SSC5D-like n=1 Tax=Ficedula albicollis TaxID=59894 RepID=UPI0007AD7E93|nr:PREDICTED: soluble scavenger receptor cysteine-rich domain-containing protein SSC5D-like [Ficedula albicollis]